MKTKMRSFPALVLDSSLFLLPDSCHDFMNEILIVYGKVVGIIMLNNVSKCYFVNIFTLRCLREKMPFGKGFSEHLSCIGLFPGIRPKAL